MPEPIYRFGNFELCSGELRANGTRIHLQEKPLLLLTTLLERPRQIVTRVELRQRMWPAGTFVDYEQGINVAMKKLRDALADSADAPLYIETVAKKGYRLLITVETIAPPPAQSLTPQPKNGVFVFNNIETDLARRPWRSIWLWGALAALISITSVALLFYRRHALSSTMHIKSIAVLPLQNLSGDPQQEYFADGITDELITNLAQLREVRVISRTSTMRYKQTKEPLTRIAQELGADVIVEGSIVRSGNRIRITAQLIDAANDRHLWASTYQHDLADVLAMQMEIARDISTQVGVALAPQQSASARGRTIDPQVYDLCLLGRFHFNKRTEGDLNQAIAYFRAATSRDPGYAAAFADLASAYAVLSYYTKTGVADDIRNAEAAARRALTLDESLSDAHATLGLLGMQAQTVNWTRTDRELRRAIELNPNSATAHHWYAYYLLNSERQGEALNEIELARQLDPLSLIINADQGGLLEATHRPSEAIARLQRAIELGPDFGQAHQTLALVYAETGRMPEAVVESRKALRLEPDNPGTIAQAGYVLGRAGYNSEARHLLAILRQADPAGAPPDFQALIYLGLGEKNRALDLLEKSCNPRTGTAPFALVNSVPFASLANEPRYQKLLARIRQMRTAQSSVSPQPAN